ncbi:MAG: YvrJ family protein [Bacillota bacterium]
MEELLKAIGNFGFPMVISAYLLIRLENRLESVSATVAELTSAVKDLSHDHEERSDQGRKIS